MGLDTVETVLWAEKEFGIEISDADASEIRTVGEFSSYIHRRLVSRDGFGAPTDGQVFERIRGYLTSYFKINPQRITHDAEFIRDLGMG